MRKGKVKAPKRRMSGTAKWTITLILFVTAIFTVVMCASSGIFTFKTGAVQANDQAEESTPVPTSSGEGSDETVYHKVFISSGTGGSVDPTGCVQVEDWGELTVNITPDKGFQVKDVTVNGESKGAVTSCTLSYIRDDQVVLVSFEKIPEPSPDSGDGDKVFSEGED